MPPLTNAKWEIFTQNWFEGKTKEESAIIAGYKPSRARQTASRLATYGNILTRYNELQQKAEDESVASVLERKQRLTEISRANLIDFVDEKGNITLDADNNGALQEVSVSEWLLGKEKGSLSRNTKIKLYSPIQAIDLLNKMEKIYGDGATVNVDNRTLTINVNSEKAKSLTERLIAGEGTGGNNDHKDI